MTLTKWARSSHPRIRFCIFPTLRHKLLGLIEIQGRMIRSKSGNADLDIGWEEFVHDKLTSFRNNPRK